MNSRDVAVRIYGLFAEDNPKLLKRIPQHVLNDAGNIFHKENIIGFRAADLNRVIHIFNDPHKDLTREQLICKELNRGVDEHFGDDIQIITAVCIHDATHVLMLRLRQETTVDGYDKDTFTYPQGHCTYNKAFVDRKNLGSPAWTFYAVAAKAKDDAYREVQEELWVEDDYLRAEFMAAFFERLFKFPTAARPYAIYCNKSGTTRRHLCLLFDVDMTNTCFSTMADHIMSHEPEKHSVEIMTFQDIIQLSRPDLLCPWVAASFSKLPFMTTTFIKDHITKIPS